MRTVKSKDARASWSDLLRRAENGETTIIEHYNRPVAKLVPILGPLRATAHTFKGVTEGAMTASVVIQNVPMADAEDYPDMAPSASGILTDRGWVLHDMGDRGGIEAVAPTLPGAIADWARQLGHRLHVIVIDPIYPPDPDADPDDW